MWEVENMVWALSLLSNLELLPQSWTASTFSGLHERLWLAQDELRFELPFRRKTVLKVVGNTDPFARVARAGKLELSGFCDSLRGSWSSVCHPFIKQHAASVTIICWTLLISRWNAAEEEFERATDVEVKSSMSKQGSWARHFSRCEAEFVRGRLQIRSAASPQKCP